MAFTLQNVVPWGRTFDEYVRMFGLTEADMKLRRILGCGDGPASFNAEAARLGFCVTSCDPIYAFTKDEIRQRIDETFEEVMAQTRANAHQFVWGRGIDSPDALGQARMGAMNLFLGDFEAGLRAGRYHAMSLPDLFFKDDAFDLALCSHFLFLYSDQLSEQFHLDAILEMLRVAPEARIFPLLNMAAQPSPHLEPVIASLRERGFDAAIAPVPYEFQKGGKWMLRVRRKPDLECGGPTPLSQDVA